MVVQGLILILFTFDLIISDYKVIMCQTVGLLIHNELERMRNEAAMSWFNILFLNLAKKLSKMAKLTVRIAYSRAEVWSLSLPNIQYACSHSTMILDVYKI
jgi:hypothetical protein